MRSRRTGNTKKFNRVTVVLLLLVLLESNNTPWCLGFAPSTSSTERRQSSRRSPLAAGFGAAPSSNNNNNKKKLRSIRGQHAGAGAKALRTAALTFDRIRKEGGKDVCGDVYVRSPLDSPTTFWFVGKVAFEKKHANAVAACLSQKRVILEYAKQELRPQNFGGLKAAALELWLAPPDSEMDVVRNTVCLEKVKGSAGKDLPDDFDVQHVGFNPEIYVGDERTQGGLRVQRDEEGRPIKEVFDVNESA